MKRFDFDVDEAVECVDGEIVRYADHRVAMKRMEEKLDDAKKERNYLIDRIAKLTGGE